MADHAFGLAKAFSACGVDAQVMDESDESTVYWGRKYTTGRECYPCILTTGDMIKTVKRTDFDAERSAFFMPSGNGPCRFGQYHRFHRMVLDDLGFEGVPIYSPSQDHRLYKELDILGAKFSRLGWRALVAADLLTKLLHEIRPYEITKGETDSIYKEVLPAVLTAVTTEGNGTSEVVRDGIRRFLKIDREDTKKPIVGIVGEIYIRSNKFSNNDVVRRVEELGGQVWLAPITEWISYVNYVSRRRESIAHVGLSSRLKLFLTDYIQNKDEHTLEDLFIDYLKYGEEPKVKDIIRKASPYIHVSFEGEAILSVGKTIDFIDKGVSGIINAMPFSCMPGTISSAIMRLIQQHHNVPIINLAYDGQGLTNVTTRLEAFMYQVKEQWTNHE